MTDRTVTHGTAVLEHVYQAPPARVFAAWADPDIKTRWFPGGHDTTAPPLAMDFRIGGMERTQSGGDGEPMVVYEGVFRDIVPDERIVVANWIGLDDERISVSQFTVEFRAEGGGTRLIATEQGAYLDGHDNPESRAIGIRLQLEALAAELGD